MKKSYIIAIVLTGLLVVWMGAGMIFKSPDATHASTLQKHKKSKGMVVEVQEQVAEPVVSYIIAQGHVKPNRAVTLRAETSGQVKEIILKEGGLVKTGDIILTLKVNDRNARLAKAQSKTNEEKRKYKAAKNLDAQGYAAKARVNEAYTALKSAQSDEKQVRLEKTSITAPFEGIIDKQQIEVGGYLSVGDEILTVVDNNPLIINTQIPQHEIAKIYNGQKADINLATGQKKEGAILFISPRAEQATRTFRVEIEVPNPEGLPSGTSATARIPKPSIMAHFISPALLTLDEKGATGIKIINEDSVVEFYPVSIVTAKSDGIYVSGLPDSAKIITAGQGFVSVGEKVAYVFSEKSIVVQRLENAGEINENN
jgi:membrane fusion protein, multidrug efflux system